MEARGAGADERELGTIETKIPARLDRLPWARFHWRVVIGLGIVWILDGLEVTIVGFLAPTLVEPGSGIELSEANIAMAQAIYVAGACIGALFFGQLTDRFGRKRLFLITLSLYLLATVATAFATSPVWFLAARFFTGAGIGGEYAAINSAIDELIPARARGRIDLIINGSFWIGAVAGGLLSLVLLKETVFALDLGWRLAFGLGALLGLGILFLRRNLPESPRWLFIHGREEEAERIVDGIEAEVRDETGQELEQPGDSIEVRQRRSIPFTEIARTVFKVYPKRAALGFSLFIGQAFIYNAVTITLGLTLTTYLGVGANKVGLFYAVWAAGNFLGPLLLGRLFDTVGRRPMIAGTYLLSAAHAGGDRDPLQRRVLQRLGPDVRARRHLLLRLRRRKLRLSDRERGLPDGDPRARDRLLLRDRYRDRRDHRPARVPEARRVRGPGPGDDRLPDRRRGDGRRRDRRADPRRAGRAAAAGGDRYPAHRAGGRGG